MVPVKWLLFSEYYVPESELKGVLGWEEHACDVPAATTDEGNTPFCQLVLVHILLNVILGPER